jgi:hypothetical protein
VVAGSAPAVVAGVDSITPELGDSTADPSDDFPVLDELHAASPIDVATTSRPRAASEDSDDGRDSEDRDDGRKDRTEDSFRERMVIAPHQPVEGVRLTSPGLRTKRGK